MARDHRKLRVFQLADELVIKVYAETATFPSEERFGLCSQIRRAAVSVPANLVEGCVRETTGDYLRFINVATGSAAEAIYLIHLSCRLNLLRQDALARLEPGYSTLLKQLQNLHKSLDSNRRSRRAQTKGPEAQSPKPRAQSPEPKA
jgi:four helix bundle protein